LSNPSRVVWDCQILTACLYLSNPTPSSSMSKEETDQVFPPVTCGSNDPPFCSHLFNLKRKLYDTIVYDTDASSKEGQDMGMLNDFRVVLGHLYAHFMKIYTGKQNDTNAFLQEMEQLMTRIFAKNNNANSTPFQEIQPLIQTTCTVIQQDALQNSKKNSEYIQRVLIRDSWQLSPISEGD